MASATACESHDDLHERCFAIDGCPEILVSAPGTWIEPCTECLCESLALSKRHDLVAIAVHDDGGNANVRGPREAVETIAQE
jgi:hypothetical protein